MSHKINDIVTPNPDAGWARRMIGTLYKVTAVPTGARGVNFKASPCDADGKILPGQGLRGPAWSLISPTEAAAAPVLVALPPVGSVCAVNVGESSLEAGFYTVIGHTDATRVRAILIGDTSGRYYRAPGKALRVLDPADVIAALDTDI